jgi:carbonic anhydrase/acetyltransferase-like protein (isoleucine patch superfamily)
MFYELGRERVITSSEDCFVAPNAAVIGRVYLGVGVNIWFSAVLRGDTNTIVVGDGSNIQDGSVVHVDHDAPAAIGRHVTVGHAATVHGCSVEDYSLIGIGATVLSHARIGPYCIVGAGALVTERKEFPERSLIIGVPAKRVREVTDEEMRMLEESAAHYVELGRRYRRELKTAGEPG